MKKLLLFSGILFLHFPIFSQQSQDSIQSDQYVQQKAWGFSITPYAMLAANSTDVGDTKIRQSFSDLSSITQAGFQIVGKVRYKRAYVLFDGTFATLGHGANEGLIDIDATVKQNIYDFRAGYTVIQNLKVKGDQVISGWELAFNTGAKYWLNDLNVNYRVNVGVPPIVDDNINEKQEWWDWMLGVNAKFMITNRFFIGVSGSTGGFGIGNASNFSYDFTYSNTFKVHKFVFVNAGYRNFRYNRTDNGTETIVNVLGPFLGVTGSF